MLDVISPAMMDLLKRYMRERLWAWPNYPGPYRVTGIVDDPEMAKAGLVCYGLETVNWYGQTETAEAWFVTEKDHGFPFGLPVPWSPGYRIYGEW